MITRNGNLMNRFDALANQVAAALDTSHAILDGEVIVADEAGRPRFYDLLRRRRAPVYVAFDLLWLDGTDLRPLPLRERRRLLQTILPSASPTISEPLSVIGRGSELFDLMCKHDLEGIVAKRLKDPYDPRVRWLKTKNPDYPQQARPIRNLAAPGAFGEPPAMIRAQALVLLAEIALASTADAAELAAPDPRLTPGAIISNDRETACTFRATPRLYQTDRSVYFGQARQVFERYGIPYDQHREYELDHLIRRCLGGTDSVLNEWPEPLAEATIKDAEEARICRAVCDERSMTLEAGRRSFTTGQWRHGG